MPATIKDIAHQAGVSLSTVSRVVNGKALRYRISKDTEAKIMQVAKELHYSPNQLARGLRLKKTLLIGLVIPDISNPFFAHITKRIQNLAHQKGYSLIVCDTDENLDLEIEHIDLLMSKGIDGLILMPVGQESKHLAPLIERNFPLVLLDRCFEEIESISVLVDDYQGAFDAVSHIIERGHRRIAIIQGLPGTSTSSNRLRGYKDALLQKNIEIDADLIVGSDFRAENGYIETKILLHVRNRPTALFTTSDLITLGALKAIDEENLAIPDDMSLVAFDDIDFAPYLSSPLTTVSQPKMIMGEIAVKMLIDAIITHRVSAQKIVLKPQLIVRNSVRRLGDGR
ncbi:LacI family DNA-binding transcriptional regulator [candidate division KSB1 bacterium]|nr:LacI family DNA-binding transcriptional regulator [candidate division KSB1 bacterium]RQW06176.1 MAG: LacI family transcriptional regulator [candidate division KSB1 bacterium]